MDLSINYPYPILSPFSKDFKMGDFNYNCDYDNARQILTVDCNLTNETIKEYINKDKMSYAIRLECPKSRYRKVKKQKNSIFKIKLDSNEINDDVVLEAFIVTNENINKFNTKHLASVYKNREVKYKVGDYVAATFSTKLKMDFKNRSSKSFIKFIKHDKTKDMDVNVNEDGINILLSKDNYNNYNNYRKNEIFSNLIFSSITVPALISSIYQILDMEDLDYDNCSWLNAIINQSNCFTLEDIKSDNTNIPKLVFEVLRNPISAFFDNINQLDDNGEEYYE